MTKAETYLLACGESLDRADLMKDLLDDTYVMVKPLLFHWTLVHGEWDDHSGYFDRWCYATRELAMDALQNFPECPPSGYEPAGWHRHPRTERRRPYGNPEKEYLEQ